MILGADFSIFASLIIACLIPLYIYRKKIFSAKYESGDDFSIFLKDLKLYMQNHHPKIHIDYFSIIEKTKSELNLEIRETLIVEDVVKQFFNFEYYKKTQNAIPKERIWVNYEEKSLSNPKYPNDWPLRKESAWLRDNKCCNRCGITLDLKDMHTNFVKEIKDGGGYNLENIITLCTDCNRIINSTNLTNPKNTMSSLMLSDKLMFFVK
ncbi:MAG: HNH endonuclease signature motif containing protein [Aliarcobacter sp.]|nr:HNH endonuclease signature motif containing protein [Aliarcobacter sp.]